MNDCPKCVTICKQPHCVTHCQAPKPECEPVCEEPKCDWKCTKPQCPKPKCELVCENPTCVPKVECCNCGMGTPAVAQPFPFFKETESNSSCCGCDQNKVATPVYSQIPQLRLNDMMDAQKGTRISYVDTPKQVIEVKEDAKLEFFHKQEATGQRVVISKDVNENGLNQLNSQVQDIDRAA
jgi:hypothetical protein